MAESSVLEKAFAVYGETLKKKLEVALLQNTQLGVGETREDFLREVLSEFLPSRYKVGGGQVVSFDGKFSNTQDVVIYEDHEIPVLHRGKRSQVYLVEAVHAVIEVKTSLYKAELRDCVNKAASVKSLDPTGIKHRPRVQPRETTLRPVGAAFAPRAKTGIATLTRNLEELNAEVPEGCGLDLVCVLDPPAIIGRFAEKLTEQGRIYVFDPSGDKIGHYRHENIFLMFCITLLNHLSRRIIIPPDLFEYVKLGGGLEIDWLYYA